MQTVHGRCRIILAFIPVILANACVPYGLRSLERAEAPLVTKAVFIDNDGRALQPKVGERAGLFADGDYAKYVGNIMTAVRSEARLVNGKKHILMRIHGGLNTLDGSLDVTREMSEKIGNDAAGGYYPIFVNWESGLLSSLGEHLFFNRRGENYPLFSLGGLPLSPLYLASDLVQGASRIPITFGRQFYNFATSPFANNQEPFPQSAAALPSLAVDGGQKTIDITSQAEQRIAASAKKTQPGPVANTAGVVNNADDITISRFGYHRSTLEAAKELTWATALTVPPNVYVWAYRRFAQDRGGFGFSTRGASVAGWIPLKPLAVYLLDALGGPSWDIMHRRTKSMFVSPNAMRDQQFSSNTPPRGAMVTLLDSLQRLIASDTTYELSVVGHSMGAIVVTEMLRNEAIRDDRPQIEIANIVFLASAASLREFQTAVLPYIERHPHAEFYNLTLHPLTEKRESNFLGIAPSGSLLQYIDSYLSHPETDTDRMIGKYENAVASLYLYPQSVRERVHIKSFGYNDGSGCGPDNALPFKHGQFSDLEVPFWRPNFWHPGVKGCEDNKKELPVELHPLPKAKPPVPITPN